MDRHHQDSQYQANNNAMGWLKAVKIIQGLVRTLVDAAAGRYEAKIPRDSDNPIKSSGQPVARRNLHLTDKQSPCIRGAVWSVLCFSSYSDCIFSFRLVVHVPKIISNTKSTKMSQMSQF